MITDDDRSSEEHLDAGRPASYTALMNTDMICIPADTEPSHWRLTVTKSEAPPPNPNGSHWPAYSHSMRAEARSMLLHGKIGQTLDLLFDTQRSANAQATMCLRAGLDVSVTACVLVDLPTGGQS